jgi:hypothetical protein
MMVDRKVVILGNSRDGRIRCGYGVLDPVPFIHVLTLNHQGEKGEEKK